MHDSSVILDPTDEREPIGRTGSPARAGALSGAVGIVDISKPRGDVFCDELETLLRCPGSQLASTSSACASRPSRGRPRPTCARRWPSGARR